MNNDITALKEKPDIYKLFANIFAQEPTVKLLEISQQQENKSLFQSYDIDPFSGLKHLSLQKQQELLAIEYARLFLAPTHLALPYESLQRNERTLWGNSAVEVNRLYKKFGFALDENYRDAPDHISVELEFLAKLAIIELEYAESGLQEARGGVLKVKKYFLRQHLLQWFVDFKDQVSKHAQLSYYKEIIKILDMFLKEEWKSLDSVGDI